MKPRHYAPNEMRLPPAAAGERLAAQVPVAALGTNFAPSGQAAMDYPTYQQAIVADLCERLAAETTPWQIPVLPEQTVPALPYHPVSGKPYRGSNAAVLMLTSAVDPRWCTHQDADAQGWSVLHGSPSLTVVYWRVSDTDPTAPPVPWAAQVVNATSIEGIPALATHGVAAATPKAQTLLRHSGVQPRHNQLDRSFYAVEDDRIHCPPPAAFADESHYLALVFHEMCHWAGHRSRLARDLSGSFGSAAYAKEELQAQLGSLWLNAVLGLRWPPATVEQHAVYVEPWLAALKNDPSAFFFAARQAQLTVDFILDLEESHDLDAEIERTPAVDLER